jgi:hypothetical protein
MRWLQFSNYGRQVDMQPQNSMRTYVQCISSHHIAYVEKAAAYHPHLQKSIEGCDLGPTNRSHLAS